MLKSVVLNMLSSYVDELDPSTTVQMSLLGGNVALDHVRFKPEGLAGVMQGGVEGGVLGVRSGRARRLHVRVPVTSLGSRAVRVEVEGVVLEVDVREDWEGWNVATCEKEMADLAAGEVAEAFGKVLVKPLAASGLFAMYHDPSSTVNRQVARVIDNVRVDCTDFVMLMRRRRRRPNASEEQEEQAFRVSWGKFSVLSCDETYQVESFDSVVDFLGRKLIQVRNLAVRRSWDEAQAEVGGGTDGELLLHPCSFDVRARINTEKDATRTGALSRVDARVLFTSPVHVQMTQRDCALLLGMASANTGHGEFRNRVGARMARQKRARRGDRTEELETEYVALLVERIQEGNLGKQAQPRTEQRCKEMEQQFFSTAECLRLLRRAYQAVTKVDPRAVFHSPLFSETWTAEAVARLRNELLPADPAQALAPDELVVVFGNRDASLGLELVEGPDNGEVVVHRVLRGQQAQTLGLVHPGMVIRAVNGVALDLLSYQGKLRVLECARRPLAVRFAKSKVGTQMEVGVVLPVATLELLDGGEAALQVSGHGVSLHQATLFPATSTLGASIQRLTIRNMLYTTGPGVVTLREALEGQQQLHGASSPQQPPPSNEGRVRAGSFLMHARDLLNTSSSSSPPPPPPPPPPPLPPPGAADSDSLSLASYLHDAEWKELYPDCYLVVSPMMATTNGGSLSALGGSSSGTLTMGTAEDMPSSPPLGRTGKSRPRWTHALHDFKRWIRAMHESRKMHALCGCSGLREDDTPGFMLAFKRSRPGRADDVDVNLGYVDVTAVPETVVGVQTWWARVSADVAAQGDFVGRLNPESPLAKSLAVAAAANGGEGATLPPRVVLEWSRFSVRVVTPPQQGPQKHREMICMSLGPTHMSGSASDVGVLSASGECALVSLWLERALVTRGGRLMVGGDVVEDVLRDSLFDVAVRSCKLLKTHDVTTMDAPQEVAVEVAFEPLSIHLPPKKYVRIMALSQQSEAMSKAFVEGSVVALRGEADDLSHHEEEEDDFRSAKGSVLSMSSSSSLVPVAAGTAPARGTSEKKILQALASRSEDSAISSSAMSTPSRSRRQPTGGGHSWTRNRLKRVIEHALEDVLALAGAAGVGEDADTVEGGGGVLDFDAPVDLTQDEMLAVLRVLAGKLGEAEVERLPVDLPRKHATYGSMTSAMLWVLLQNQSQRGGGPSPPAAASSSAPSPVSPADTAPPPTYHVGVFLDKVTVRALDCVYLEVESMLVGAYSQGELSVAQCRIQRGVIREDLAVGAERPLFAIRGEGLSSSSATAAASFTVRKSTRTSLDKDMVVCVYASDGSVVPSRPRFLTFLERYFKGLEWGGGGEGVQPPPPPREMRCSAVLTGVRIVATYAAKRTLEEFAERLAEKDM